jgi:S-(hydroxymethyl)glutathione dehydrogenase/alcohol dehydrogenase
METKLEAARIFGATHTINARREDAIAAVQRLTSGRGSDWVFVTSGNIAAIQQGYSMSAPRGTTVFIGLTPVKESFCFVPMEFIRFEKAFIGAFMGSTRPDKDIRMLVEPYQAGRLKLDELITGRYPLERINEAIESVEKGEALRNVIMF